ncbi:MAG TPA: MFS transporter, partial [Anaerolineales bacterium]|nr:MFS transporter [Anaerolineales bacterium]
ALGTIMALIGIPRAVFMLVGGAVTDKYSPRVIMLVSDMLRLVLIILLAVMILTGWLQLWTLYVLALLFGTISGFFGPASGAILPLLVKPDELTISNSIYTGMSYLTSFVGPVLAGGLIALFAHARTAQSGAEMTGIAAAMLVDAFTFLISVGTLLLMKWKGIVKPQPNTDGNILASIKVGIAYLWRDDLLRTMFILMLAANFLFVGPMLVGMPVLADTRLAGGAAAYGTVMSAFGGGNLLGILLTNSLLQVVGKRLGAFMVAVIGCFGVALVLMGMVSSTAVAFVILLIIGLGNGVLEITMITFLQRKTPKEMLGRVMSMVMLAGIGLVPISQALTGAFIKLSLTGLFFGAGSLMLLVTVWMALQPLTRTIHQVLTAES